MRKGEIWMKTIEFYGENYLEQYMKLREACRGIVIRNDEILLTYEVNTDQWFIPGGGVEKDECIQECCVRELVEETGCIVEIDKPYLTINEHYDEWLFVSHYYICNYVGETERTLTEREIEVGLEPRWVSLKEAIEIFSKHQEYENDMKRGAYLREYNALLSYVESVEM